VDPYNDAHNFFMRNCLGGY